MSNIFELPQTEDPIEAASLWITKIDRGLRDEELVALRKWVAAKPENQEALTTVAEMWDKMNSLSRLTELFPRPDVKHSPARWISLAVAATVFLAVSVGMLFESRQIENNPTERYADIGEVYETRIGEQSLVVLSDGSQLRLNTDTRVKFINTGLERRLMLEQGEIHITVKKDKIRPFNVYVNNNIVQAVGTAFNLELTSDQRIELIVTEGKVLVAVLSDQQPMQNAESSFLNPESSLAVSAGEQLLLGNAEDEVELIEPDDLEVKLAWQGGNLIFRGESLAEAITEIERYTTIEFTIVGESLKKIRVAGVFKADDVEGLLETLRNNFNIIPERIGKDKIILIQK